MDGPIRPNEIFFACFFFIICWLMAYVSVTRKPDVGMDSRFMRYFYRMSDDQINASHLQGAIFAAFIGTLAPVLIIIRSHTGRQIAVAIFLIALLASPVILFFWKRPRPSPDAHVTAMSLFFKNSTRVISLITLVFAFLFPIFAYQHGAPATFAVIGFVLLLIVPVSYFFVSLY